MPKALQEAGFEVATLCPSETFLAKTRHVDRKFVLPNLNASVVAAHFINTIQEWKPQLIVLGDERVQWFLHRVVTAHDEGKEIGLDAESMESVRHSLPNRTYFHASIDKFTFRELADKLGVRVPPYRVVHSMADAMGFAEEHGYPVVFKNGMGTGGSGVTICKNEDELVNAAAESFRLYFGARSAGRKMTIEKFITGQICSIAAVAHRGEYLAGVMCEKTECYPPVTGPSTVRRYFDLPEVHEFVGRILKETEFNGFCGMDFIIEAESGLPYIVEWNARITSPCSIGPKCGVDLCGALHHRLLGEPVPQMEVKEGWMVALYPQELIRDPKSPYVDTIYHDMPCDDPDLLSAFERHIKEHRQRENAASGRIQ